MKHNRDQGRVLLHYLKNHKGESEKDIVLRTFEEIRHITTIIEMT